MPGLCPVGSVISLILPPRRLRKRGFEIWTIGGGFEIMIGVVQTDRSLIYDLLAIGNPAPAEGPGDFKRRDKLLCLGGWNKRRIESGLIYADRSPPVLPDSCKAVRDLTFLQFNSHPSLRSRLL